jgi:hypothetical protein
MQQPYRYLGIDQTNYETLMSEKKVFITGRLYLGIEHRSVRSWLALTSVQVIQAKKELVIQFRGVTLMGHKFYLCDE